MSNPACHWAFMNEMRPGMREKWQAFTAEMNPEEAIPKKYRELMLLGQACVLRSAPAIKSHAEICMNKYGATKEEIFTVLVSSISLGGIPAYREACVVLEDMLTKEE